MTPSFVCAGLEIALNRYLQLEPAVLEQCASLSSDSIELHITGLDWRLFIEFSEYGVRVLDARPAGASLRLSGPPPAYAQLAWNSGRDGHALPATMEIEGDAEVLQRFRRLLGQVGFDFEEWLSPLLGGTAAHRFAQGLQQVLSWGRRSADTLAQDTAEYLREETRDLARGADVAEWMDQVDRLRERTDRLEKRLARLESKRP